MSVRKWGTETLVNATTAGNQRDPASTALADGGYVIAWEDLGTTPDSVKLQVYNANGTKRGGEITAPTFTGDDVINPALAPLDSGGFVLSFDRIFSPGDPDTRFQLYDANGSTVGGGGTLDVGSGVEELSAVSSLGAGFVAVWRDGDLNAGDIELRGFNATGTQTIATTVVNTTTAGNQTNPDVAELAGGRFVVVWEDQNGTDSVRGRVFEANGTPVAVDFLIASTNSINSDPHVTALANGGFVVTYADSSVSFPESGLGVRARIYNPDGGAFSGEIIVNSDFLDNQFNPAIAALPNGGFVIVWKDNNAPEIRGQVFDVLGNRMGTEFIVNTQDRDGTGTDSLSVSALPDGRFVVSWFDGSSPEDGSGDGIFSQIMDPRDGVVNGTTSADTLFGNYTSDEINGHNGADTIFGREGIDRIFGGDSGDSLFGEAGNDLISGNSGADQIFGGDGNDNLDGGLGADQIIGGEGLDIIFGGAGGDLITGDAGDDQISGNDGDDKIFGDNFNVVAGNDAIDGGAGADQLSGFGGNDIIFGGTEGDSIDGGDGNDVIKGQAGNDFLGGGAGGDFFQFDGNGFGADTFLDFTVGTDKLLISTSIFGNFAALNAASVPFGAGTAIFAAPGDVMNLTTVTFGTLTASDVDFF